MQAEYAEVAFVTVTFNPDVLLLEAQLNALPAESLKIVVDNASDFTIFKKVEDLITRLENAAFLRNESNIGLAAAINEGARVLSLHSRLPRWILMLDQDSEPLPGSILALIRAYKALESSGNKVGCVGPALLDPTTQLQHGFHQSTRWRWKRVYPSRNSTDPVSCMNLNGSGTLTSMDLFQRLGGMDDGLFIDHVDTDWAFRVLASGYSLWGIPNAQFIHRMGGESIRIWCFGWRVWPMRSPRRHYFLFRNAAILLGRDYVPNIWKFWAVMKLVITLFLTSLLGPERKKQLAGMMAGIRDAVRLR